MKLKELENKKILILGLGREGESTFLVLRKRFPQKIFGLADKLSLEKLPARLREKIQKDKKVKLHLGRGYLKAVKDYEVIIKTPGIPAKKIKTLLKKNQIVTSQTEIFFQECKGKIIGVTGTKGKSTTSSLIYEILKQGGRSVLLLGNIGKPPLSFLAENRKDTLFVFELSSHQLLELKKSPQVAVFLNIYPEHLDYYLSFKQYFRAKQNITLYQKKKDCFIFNADQKELRKLAQKTKAKKFPFSKKELSVSQKADFKGQCFLRDDTIITFFEGKEEKIMKAKEIPLLGQFNLFNVMASILVAKIFKVPSKEITKAIKNFKGLPHRLEYVGKYKGIKFYNDSLATIPEATMEALETLGENVETLLLGGFDRGVNFKKLAKKLWQSKVKTIILFPESGLRIWQEIVQQRDPKKNLPSAFLAHNMKEAVKLAFENTSPGKICLLSPASASFNLFKDYRERGDLFKKEVRAFQKEKGVL